MIRDLVNNIVNNASTKRFAGLTMDEICAFEAAHDLHFPAAYREFLTVTNGVELLGGCDRVYGLGQRACLDGVWWNQFDTWKFAFPPGCEKFWCFGGTYDGDQFAFALSDIGSGADAPVYWLNNYDMSPHPHFPSFTEMLEKCVLPDDRWLSTCRNVVDHFGQLTARQLLISTPPSVLCNDGSDDDDYTRMMVLDARTAMIFNGDALTQLFDPSVSDDDTVDHVEPYVDEKGRMRLRVVWLRGA